MVEGVTTLSSVFGYSCGNYIEPTGGPMLERLGLSAKMESSQSHDGRSNTQSKTIRKTPKVCEVFYIRCVRWSPGTQNRKDLGF